MKKFALSALAAAALAATPLAASAVDLTYDVSSTLSYDSLGDGDNVVVGIDIGALSTVTEVAWDVQLTTVGTSWLAETSVQLSDSALSNWARIQPGIGGSGFAHFVGSLVLPNGGVTVGTDGILKLEFYETFDDYAGLIDSIWHSGSLVISYTPVPEPGTYGLMALGLAGVVLAARRRRAG